MRQRLSSIITAILRILKPVQLAASQGDFFIDPKPEYLSQFVGIYPADITMGATPLTDKAHNKKYGAKDSEEFTFWAWRNCGIICVQMILETKGKLKDAPTMQLTKEGIELGGYILYKDDVFVDLGWFHHALVALLQKYGIKANMKKWQSLQAVAADILANKYVILSVMVPDRRSIAEDGSFAPKPNAKYGGHLLLATGVKMNGKKVEGIYVHDPRGLAKYQADTYIPAATLKKIFSNRTIVAE